MAAAHDYRLGIDLGGSKILALVIDARGVVVSRSKRRSKPKLGYQGVLERLHKTALEALQEAGLRLGEDIQSLGVGLPGPVLPKEGIIQGAVNLGWPVSPIAEDLSRLFAELPVAIGNDVNFGALGEASHGAGHGADSCFAMFMGTGLGAAWVNQGQVLAGAHGFAGEIGHLPGPFDGALCSCGQHGCLETVASKTGIARIIGERLDHGKKCVLSAEEIADLRSSALRRGWDADCQTVRYALRKAAKALAWGIAVGGLSGDPQRFILGGGVIEELGPELLPIILEAIQEFPYYARAVTPDVHLAQLGDDAVAIGAAVASRTQL